MTRLRSLTRALTTAAVALTTALATLLAPSAAHAAGARYVALGDSYSSGVGAGPYDLSGCFRSWNAYGPMWSIDHYAERFDFPACGGAVTADVLNNQLGALNTGTTLVSITIGGNDIGFAGVVATCKLADDLSCLAQVNQATSTATTVLPGRLDQVYAAIRNRAPNAKIVVLGYPRLFEEVSDCGWLSMNLYKRRLLNSAADKLAGVIGSRVAAAGLTWVDMRPWFAGHGICGPSPWLVDASGVIEAYHPRFEGYRYGYLRALESVAR